MQLLLWFYVSSCGFKELIKSSLKPLQKAWKSLFNHKSIYHSDGLHVILRCLNFSVHIAPKRHFQTSSTPSIFSIKLIFFRALFFFLQENETKFTFASPHSQTCATVLFPVLGNAVFALTAFKVPSGQCNELQKNCYTITGGVSAHSQKLCEALLKMKQLCIDGILK